MNRNYFVIDLFAGCGGLSEGFKQAGFDMIAQVEMDKWACETLRTRHVYHGLKERGKGYLYHRYLRGQIGRENILDRFPDLREAISHRVVQAALGEDGIDEILKRIEASKKFHGSPKFHVLLGGPPCQPYSLIGRARDPSRMENDNRHYLYRHYLQILQNVQPDFFVYENVPGLFSAKARGKEIFIKLLEDFSLLEPAYEITPPLEQICKEPRSYILDSADFHVPQTRKRLIVIGYKRSLERKNPGIKAIFRMLQKRALKSKNEELLTVNDAISDLPELGPGEGSDGWFSPYNCSPNLRYYQRKMRKDSRGVLNHRARTHIESDLERYRFFIEHRMNGNGAATLNDLREQRPELVPNHKHLDKFVDRFKVQWWTRPSSTITAHIRKDGHYYIHPDISQCRSFTVREAARCQSFPDNFKFEGPRTEQFKQVGNAVPPLFACAIARAIIKELRKNRES